MSNFIARGFFKQIDLIIYLINFMEHYPMTIPVATFGNAVTIVPYSKNGKLCRDLRDKTKKLLDSIPVPDYNGAAGTSDCGLQGEISEQLIYLNVPSQ